MIHVGSELVLMGGIVYFLNNKCSKLSERLDTTEKHLQIVLNKLANIERFLNYQDSRQLISNHNIRNVVSGDVHKEVRIVETNNEVIREEEDEEEEDEEEEFKEEQLDNELADELAELNNTNTQFSSSSSSSSSSPISTPSTSHQPAMTSSPISLQSSTLSASLPNSTVSKIKESTNTKPSQSLAHTLPKSGILSSNNVQFITEMPKKKGRK